MKRTPGRSPDVLQVGIASDALALGQQGRQVRRRRAG
jgi:hypothetical protein